MGCLSAYCFRFSLTCSFDLRIFVNETSFLWRFCGQASQTPSSLSPFWTLRNTAAMSGGSCKCCTMHRGSWRRHGSWVVGRRARAPAQVTRDTFPEHRSLFCNFIICDSQSIRKELHSLAISFSFYIQRGRKHMTHWPIYSSLFTWVLLLCNKKSNAITTSDSSN